MESNSNTETAARSAANLQALRVRLMKAQQSVEAIAVSIGTYERFGDRSAAGLVFADGAMRECHGLQSSLDQLKTLVNRESQRATGQLPSKAQENGHQQNGASLRASRGVGGETKLDRFQGKAMESFNAQAVAPSWGNSVMYVGSDVGSAQVANDRPEPQPRPSWAAEVDRQVHRQEMKRDDERAKKGPDYSSLIEAKQQQGAEQGSGRSAAQQAPDLEKGSER